MRRNNDQPGRCRWQPGIAASVLLFGMLLMSGPTEAQTAVLAEPVRSHTFVDRIEALGSLLPNESVDITAPVLERIETLNFDDGDRVVAGQLLAQLENDQEEAQLAEAQATRREAAQQLQRALDLAQRGAGAVSQVDERRRQLDVAQARERVVQAELDYRSVRAPFDGRLGLRTVSPGATVGPGDVIATLIDDRTMKLDFTVPSVHLARIHTGIRIEARSNAWPDEVFHGTVSAVDSRIDPVTRAFRVRAVLPNGDGKLLSGMLMQVDLLVDPRQSPAVPEASVIVRGAQSFVLVLQPDGERWVVVEQPVHTGLRSNGLVEVLDGLAAGVRVVAHGTSRVRPGQAVVLQTPEALGLAAPPPVGAPEDPPPPATAPGGQTSSRSGAAHGAV